MSSPLLFLLVIAYLGLLFFIAFWAEKKKSNFWINNPYIYSLSLAVYCSAWTYYGSIGVASNQGLEYLAIYIGPVIIIPSWIYINSKIIRISRVHKISSIADFISLRYGNSRSLGALVAIVCMLAVIPYIGLQIKAISDTFHLMTNTANSDNIFLDTATYVVVIIAVFSAYYGTQYVDASEKRLGIISAVAVESFLKLIFFVILGIFVVYWVFNGFNDIYEKASELPDFAQKNTFNGLEGGFNWFLMCMLSMTAIFLLPRQFHTTIVENRTEKHLKTAIWLFPLYLLIMNFFVFPIAWGGKILFFGENVNPEFYSILIPQKFGNMLIAGMVFLGGLSACISMIIISSISLSVMLSNNIIIPYGWLNSLKTETEYANNRTIVNIRKFSIFSLIILGFVFYKPLLQLFEQKHLHHSEVNLLQHEIFEFDEMKMIQVFQNILGNALKFANEQGMIQTKFQEKNSMLKISIFNTGKTIPTEDLQYVFEKFYQSKNQNLRKPLGSGLGLAICKRIISAPWR